MEEQSGWIDGRVVTMAGTGINLGLGVLYAWSVLKGGIPDSWGWSNADKALPYAVACFVFSVAMVLAGRLQDKYGPKMVAMVGGGLVGTGCILAGMTAPSLTGFIIGFGVIGGLGIGFGYAATTPAAIKWFPPSRTGMIAGIVVAGFGLAPVFIAPLASWLLGYYATTTPDGVVEKGVAATVISFGMGFLVIVSLLAQLLQNPPDGYVAAGAGGKGAYAAQNDIGWKDVVRTAQFYVLWLMYFLGAAAGLTFISVAQDLGKKSLGELAFVAVVVLAIGNALGRIMAGTLSDRLGRQWTMFAAFVFQAVVVLCLFLLSRSTGTDGSGTGPSFIAMTLGVVLFLGANYGANLSLFPSVAKDFWGLKGFGVNYGLLFTAWGAAGLLMPWINGQIKDVTGSQDLTYFIIMGMMGLAAALTFLSRSLATRAKAH
jgi:OFA family oxalate/formate antiporter-like MFS transporter